MILDSSAVLSILRNEADSEVIVRAIATADSVRISAANFVEVSIVLEAQTGGHAGRQLDDLFRQSGVVIEPVTEEQAHVARQGWLDFGKGRHPAGLNFGDCFAYALAKVAGEPLLFKGDDFRKTDLTAAL